MGSRQMGAVIGNREVFFNAYWVGSVGGVALWASWLDGRPGCICGGMLEMASGWTKSYEHGIAADRILRDRYVQVNECRTHLDWLTRH